MSRQLVRKWLTKLDVIRDSYPFGPLEILRDANGEIHSIDGPAIKTPTRVSWYENGKKHGLDVDIFGSVSYFFQGVMVPKDFVINPDKITYEEILNNPNAEVRRVGMEIYGFDRLLAEGKVKIIHEDKNISATLIHINVKPTKGRHDENEDEYLALVKVKDGTPSITGDFKFYFLRVPPEVTTCKQAIAWTFRRTKNDYHPSIER